ncbi:MAG: pseudouridine-5'-phosphate glycosidase [Chloroflexota bacterium]
MTAYDLHIATHIQQAIQRKIGRGLLESTVITHGLLLPTKSGNCFCRWKTLSATVGIMPATIGVVGGRIIVGMNEDEIGHLAQAAGNSARKWPAGAICPSH